MASVQDNPSAIKRENEEEEKSPFEPNKLLISGLSESTTDDGVLNFIEAMSGEEVKEVNMLGKSKALVTMTEDITDMERILARQGEKPHVLNKAQLSVRIFHELLEDDNDKASGDSGSLGATADGTDNTTKSQRPEPKAQQLHMAVDPDVMEYVTTTALHNQLKMVLATKKSEINWKPNSKTAVIVYRGEDKSDSWQSECIEEVQTYLGKFAKRDVEVNKDFWEAVIAQLSAIRACFGVDSPLVKTIEESFVARIVSLSSDAKDLEEKLKAKLEEIYREETRKTYVKKKEDVPIELLVLLKKIKFAEKLQEKNKELEIKLDTEAEEIYFEGPQQQFMEATMKFHKQISGMVEKKLIVSGSILEVLASDDGLQAVKYELEKNNVEAVFVIDIEARIVGTSAAQADKAVSLVSKLTLEEKVRVDEKSRHLLKTLEWHQLCEQLNAETAVRVHRNNWNDTYVTGFREDVNEAMKTLIAYLDKNCIREEQFKCPSKIVRRYLSELCQDDLRSIEAQLADFEVKIQSGKGDDDFVISGNKEGLKRAKRKLDALADSNESEKFDVKQPGLRKYFASGKRDRLVKSVEKDRACAVHVQKQDDMRTRATEVARESDSSSSNDEEEEMEDAVGGTDPRALVTRNGHKISWKPGNIETEQADILVSSQGASSKAIINAGGLAMKQNLVAPNVGDITVTPGFALACSHVIYSNCSQWHGGKGEQVLRGIVQKCLQKNEELGGTSIAFPVIGAGKLNFPPDAASRIMLEETITFCQVNPSSTVKDIRFVVFQQDQALITAFTQEMANIQSKYKVRPAYTMGGLFRHLRSKFRRTNQMPGKATGGVSVEVLQGNLCLETTDAIVNINYKDMNMDSSGALCKAVKQAGGQGVQDECNQLGHQPGGSAVMTSGGNLSARYIIHLIPDSADKNHLQQCVEKCLGLAEARGIQSISFPAVGTGAFHMSAADSASLIFQALSNFNASFNVIRKVRIVVFQAPMLQAFQQEQQRHYLFSNQGGALPLVSNRVSRYWGLSIEVVNGNLTQEKTDAIMNIISTDMNMNNAGELSKAILQAGGPQIQQELSQMGKQTSGTAVMTGGGRLEVRHVIHIIPGSTDKQHLQTCLKAGLRLADQSNLHSISIPTVGTGGYGLAAADSAQVTFQALNSFSGSCQNVRNVRIVVFQAQMVQDFLQAQQVQAMQAMDEQDSDSSSEDSAARQNVKHEIEADVGQIVEWSYEIHGTKMAFDQKTNAKIEMAYSKEQPTVHIYIDTDEFIIDIKHKTGRGGRNGETIALSRKVKETKEVVPFEINLRGPLALEAYNKALTEGKACVKRVPVMLIGQDHSGKTSLKNSLMGKPFNKAEDSTVGIDVDPSHFIVSSEIWKAGESAGNVQAEDVANAISFEHHAARLVAEHFKVEEKNFLEVASRKSGSLDVTILSNSAQLSSPSSEDSREASESVQTPKNPKVKRIPEASSDPTRSREEHSPLTLSKIPDEVESLIKKILQEVEKLQDEEEIYSVLWDFGGQSIYYATHPLFITSRAMYLLVHDLSRDPHERAEPTVKQGMYNRILDNHGAETNLSYLNFWMTSVTSLASEDEDQHVRSDQVQVTIPPVFLVCTHADEPYRKTNPLNLAREVFGSLQTKSYRNHLYEDVFVVDNTKSGTESECPEVMRLREKVLAVAKGLPQMKEAIPIKWLKFEKALKVTVKEGKKWISLEMAKQIASEVCEIKSDQEFLTLLNFLHDQRILIHFDDTPVLSNMVVLDPQWLVDVFRKVITVRPYDSEEKEFKELWRSLESTGILDEKLLQHVWGPLLEKQETSASLLEILEKFSLLCPWPSSDATCGKQYLVPSMLMSHPPDTIVKLVASAQIPSIFLKFESGQVPQGLFPRFVLQFFQWGQDKFWSAENPQLYHNFARFYTSRDEDCSVILLCHSSAIEVVVHRGNLNSQSKLNISEDTHYDAFEVACVRAVRRQVGLMLECMRKEFCWLKNMKYEVGVKCPVCCENGRPNYCNTHHKPDCEQEECLHFWTESVLRGANQFVRCRKCAAAQNDKVYVKLSAPWIETSNEQLTIDNTDGTLSASEGENDEKLLALLPSKELASLLSQQCDPKEVVLQLKHRLQLDQTSLEQPNPGTKRLIRCLATKAKHSDRLDVFDHLREITPAGTTGPRLRDCLDIRQIPFRQMTALTVGLSGGHEWKIVAEELGLNSDEIRYLDNRTLNPCEALLAYISQHCYRSVGYLYNILNKCELPLAADIL